MKALLVTLVLLVTGTCAFGQVMSIGEQKVLDVYGQNQFNEMKANNPGMLAVLGGFAEHGFSIEQNTNPKYNSAEQLTQVPLRSKTGDAIPVQDFITAYTGGNFNILNYGFMPSKTTQVYRLQGTDYLLVIDRQETILSE